MICQVPLLASLESSIDDFPKQVDSEDAQTQKEIATLRRRRIAKVLFAKAGVTFAFVAFFEADVIDDKVVDDYLLRAQPPHPLLG